MAGIERLNKKHSFTILLCKSYDVRFKYKGQNYYIVNWEDVCARTDESLKIFYEKFPDPLTLIEQLTIDGVNLLILRIKLRKWKCFNVCQTNKCFTL